MNIARTEQLLARLSIRDKAGKVIPFVVNRTQRRILEKMKELQAEGKPPWIIVLKSRRLGVSTLTEGLLIAHCLSQPNAQAMLVAHQYKSAGSLFRIAQMMKDSLPKELGLPSGTQHLMEFPHKEGKSRLEVATAGSTAGGRGLSLSALHLSEAAFFPMASGSFTALLPTIPYRESTMLIIESTANGKVNDGEAFYNYWQDSVEGRTDFTPIFIPWTEDTDCLRAESEAADAPIDDDEEELLKMGLTKGHIAWRRWTMATECHGMKEIFDQEFPITPEVAFISTGFPAFTRSDLADARKSIAKPILTGLLMRESGQTIFHKDQKGFRFWEKPEKDHRYYVGADCARGVEDGDFAAIVVWNGSTGDVAARFSERIGAERMADLLDMIGRYYNRAMINIELTGNTGTWVQSRLRDQYHYPNLYIWRGGRDDKRTRQMTTTGGSIGWETTYRSRQLLFSAFREGLITGRIGVRDEALLTQMEGATMEEGWRWEVRHGHDDIMMAAMVGWIAVCQYPPPKILGSRKLLDVADAESTEYKNIQNVAPWYDDARTALKRRWKEVRKPTKNRLAGV